MLGIIPIIAPRSEFLRSSDSVYLDRHFTVSEYHPDADIAAGSPGTGAN
jgi:hypothetical protein